MTARPLRTVRGFGVLAHGAELHHLEEASVLTHPVLVIEHGPIRVEIDSERDQRNQRQRENQTDQRDNERERAPNPAEGCAAVKTLAKHQPTGIQTLDLDL